MKRLAILLLLSVTLAISQNAIVVTTADFTGDGANHAFASVVTSARWVQIIAATANAAVVRIGDTNISATRGLPMAAGSGLSFPPMPPDARFSTSHNLYDLSKIFYRAGSGDKISVAWGQ